MEEMMKEAAELNEEEIESVSGGTLKPGIEKRLDGAIGAGHRDGLSRKEMLMRFGTVWFKGGSYYYSNSSSQEDLEFCKNYIREHY